MAQVTLRINGYPYTVGCQDGEEAHLQSMATEIEKRIDTIKALGGQSGESRMLVMAALLMADDLYELGKTAKDSKPVKPADPKLGRRLSKLAQRAEDIAAELEHP